MSFKYYYLSIVVGQHPVAMHRYFSKRWDNRKRKNNANAVTRITRSSSRDEKANVNFVYDDIVHVLQNTKLTVQRSGSLQKFFIMVKSDL